MLNTNPRNYVMRDFAQYDERSAAVQLLGRRVAASPKADADRKPGFFARHSRLATSLVGLALGVSMVIWMNSV